jgi:hypothetical protein
MENHPHAEMPDESGASVGDDARVLLHFAREAVGAAAHPAFPASPFFGE